MGSAPLLTMGKPTRDKWLNAKYVDREETQDGLENQEISHKPWSKKWHKHRNRCPELLDQFMAAPQIKDVDHDQDKSV
jgi:hypothetical protein